MPFKRFKGVLERPFRVFEEKLRYLPFKASESYNRFSQPF